MSSLQNYSLACLGLFPFPFPFPFPVLLEGGGGGPSFGGGEGGVVGVGGVEASDSYASIPPSRLVCPVE